MMWRRVLIALAAAAPVLLVAGVLYVRSEAGGRRLCGLAEKALRDATGEELQIGRCRVEPLRLSVRLEDLSFGGVDGPLRVTIERADVRLLWSALFTGRVGLGRVHLVAPLVAVDVGRFPESSAAPKREGPCIALPSRLEIGEVSIEQGALRLALASDAEVNVEALELAIAGGRDGLGGRLRAGAVTGKLDDREFTFAPLETSASLDVATQSLALHRLEATSPEVRVSATGVLPNLCLGHASLELELDVDLDRAASLLEPLVNGLGGRAQVAGTVSVDDEGPRATAQVQLEGGRALGLGPFDATAEVALLGLSLEVRSLHTRIENGEAQATGTLELRPPFATSLSLEVDDLVMGEILSRLTVPDLTVHMEMTGRARATGVLAGPEGFVLSGRIDTRVSDFGVYSRPWHQRAGADRWVRVPQGSARTDFTLRSDRLELRNTRLRSGTTDVHGKGVIHFHTDRGMDIEFEAPSAQGTDLGPFGPVDLAGHGTVRGSVKGPYSNLDIRGRAVLEDVNLMGLELRKLAATGRIHDDRLEVSDILGIKQESVFTGGGWMSFESNPKIAGRLDLHQARAQDLLRAARRFQPQLVDALGPVTASISGSVSVAGRMYEPDGFLLLDVAEAEVLGQPVDVGRVVASIEAGDSIEIDRLWARSGGAALEGSGRLSLRSRELNASLTTRGIRIEEVPQIAAQLPGLTGGATVVVNARGTLDEPRVEGLVDLIDWYLDTQPLVTSRLALRLRNNRVRVQGSIVSPWPRDEEPPLRTPGDPLPMPPGSMMHAVRADVALEPGFPFGFEMSVGIADLKALAAPGVLVGVEGSVSGRLHAMGELADWRSVEGRLELPRVWVRRDRYRVDGAAPAVLTLSGGELVLETLPLRGPGFELDAEGQLRPDGRVAFNLQGSADLGMLPRLLSDVEEARGHADLKVAVSGTLTNPTVVGQATLERAGGRLRGLPAALTDAHGSLTFSPDAVLVDGMKGRLNGGEVEAAGHLALERLRPQALDLRLRLDDIPLRLDGTPVLISGTPELRGTFEAMTLGGDMEITRLHFRQDLDLERTALRAWELSRRPPAPQVLERAGEFLHFDLGIRLGDVRVDNNLVNAEIRGDLRVTGTQQRPGLLGTLTVSDARARLRSTEFNIDSGVVTFTDRTRIRPSFDLRAETRVREFTVNVVASGTPQQPRLLLSSEPPLSEADILMLLTLGVTSFDLDRADAASLSGFLVDAAYNASGIGDQVRRLMPSNVLMRDATFRMTSSYSEISGQIEPIAQFETNFLLEGLKLRAQTSLMGGRGRRAQAEYRLDEGISAQAQWDSENPSAPSSGDIGADIKIHWESR